MDKSKVYFTKEITKEAMIKMYDTLGIKLEGKVAVKLHSGEVGNQNFLRPDFMAPIINHVKGTIVECNTAYEGKRNSTEKHKEAMKENGIGRPSTRASIIETLFKRRYIYRERKNIMASQAGIDLIATINEELLKSAKLTGLWENKLRRIERGDYSAAEFISELKSLISDIVVNVLSDNSAHRIVIEDDKNAEHVVQTG